MKTSKLEKVNNTFLRGLKPPGFKQKIHQALIEYPNKEWGGLQLVIFNKDTSLVISAEMSGLQQSSFNTGSTHELFTKIKKSFLWDQQ